MIYLGPNLTSGQSAVIFSAPHGGRIYPPNLCAATHMDVRQLSSLEDGHTDGLLAPLVLKGHTIISANAARAYIDPNRGRYEWDYSHFDRLTRMGLPQSHPDTFPMTAKAEVGLGLIPSINGRGQKIYASYLSIEEYDARIRAAYAPYHAAISAEIMRLSGHHEKIYLLDVHSMPADAANVDIVIGTNFGAATCPKLLSICQEIFTQSGLSHMCDRPFSGGFITCHYGAIDKVSAVQIEFSRVLYLKNDGSIAPKGNARLQQILADLGNRLTQST